MNLIRLSRAIVAIVMMLTVGLPTLAHDFEVDGIYYNYNLFSSSEVEVTSGTKNYTGNVVIPSSVTYNGNNYSVTSIGQNAFRCDPEWTSLGEGTYSDIFFFDNKYKVAIQQSKANPNKFRVVKPYHEGLPNEGWGGPYANTDNYLYFNLVNVGDTLVNTVITNHDNLVYFEQFNTGYVHPSYDAEINLLHPALFNRMTEADFAWNKVLSYQENGLPAQIQLAPLYYMNGIGAYDYHNKDKSVLITFPGVVIKDYSVEFDYLEQHADKTGTVYADFNLTMGEDVAYVKVGIAQTDDANTVANGIIDGSINSVKATENGKISIALTDFGSYTAVAVAYDTNNNPQKIDFTQFNYTKSEWKSLGMAQYTDDFIASLAEGMNPATYNVEIQESEETPGLYRLVNPYGAAFPYNQDGDWDKTKDYYLEIDATDPQGVYIKTQELGFDWGYGMFSASSIAGYYMENGETFEAVKAAGYCGTLVDGVITFPTQALLITAPDLGGWSYANVNGAFKVVLPSATANTSKSVNAVDNKTITTIRSSKKLNKNAQKMEQVRALEKTKPKVLKSNKSIESRTFSTDLQKIALNTNRKNTLSNNSSESTSELTSVTIPNSVTSIGYAAFAYCTGLKEVNIGNSLKEVAEFAFYDCKNLTEVNISDLSAWCKISFKNETSNPTYHAKKLKLNGSEIVDLEIPNDVTYLLAYTFINCEGIKSVYIPATTIPFYARTFDGCTGIENYNVDPLNEKICSIDGIVFAKDKSGIQYYPAGRQGKYDIPYGVEYISSHAFKGCIGLNEVSIPNSVTHIYSEAFHGCANLNDITIPASVTKLYGNAFYNTGWYNKQADGVLYLDDWCLGYKGELTGNISLKEGTKAISDKAFYNCTKLTGINIPNTVKSIGYLAFSFCESLTEIEIPNSVTSIESAAFQACSKLTNVTIPNSISKINVSTFSRTGIKSINIPESVTTIGGYAFQECDNLESVSIPNSVSIVEQYAFSFCNKLKEIELGSNVDSIGVYAFHSDSLLNINVAPENKTFSSIDGVFFNNDKTTLMQYPTGREDTAYIVPNTVEKIATNAFYECKFTRLELPKSLKKLECEAFIFCYKIKEITSLNPEPPICEEDAYFVFNTSCVLYVPAGSKDAYATAAEWCEFTNIVEMATVEVSTQEKNATFEIPTTEGAVSYTVNVYSDEAMTQLVATTNYDATGKIIPMATSLELSIDGFEDGTYYYNVVAKSETGETLSNYTGTFEIDAAGVDGIKADNGVTEVARYDIHGHLLTQPTQGVNIVKYSDGTTRKECVKK